MGVTLFGFFVNGPLGGFYYFGLWFHRNQLRAQLTQLPEATNKVEVVVPDGLMVEEEDAEDVEEDAADAKIRKQETARRAKEMEMQKMSQVL